MTTAAGRTPRRGRRPGAPDTRAAILTAARDAFAEKGYAGASVRAIASSVGVDPALVHHYFGSKSDLFVAALEAPVDPRVVLAPVAEGGVEGAGERLMRVFVSVWDDEAVRPGLLALLRHMMEPSGRVLVPDALSHIVLGPVVRGLGVDQPERRTVLVASQVIGLVMVRYVLAAEPLASMPREELVQTYAPTFQRYLGAPLP